MADFKDGYWLSADGLKLHYREYAGRDDRPPILCLPGLTRNARDFEPVADRLAGEWRLICVDLRGRGESGYAKDPLSYVPLIYLQDIERLIAEIGLERFVAFGTSLGGLLTMFLSASAPERIAGALLNDVGPVLDPAGLERIRGYVGISRNHPTWVHAARALQESQRTCYPNYDLEDWLGMAKRLFRLTPGGRVVLDYDMKIAEVFRAPEEEAVPDLWPALESLKDKPVLFVRGASSDILSEETLAEMRRRLPDAEAVTVPNVGHAPLLDEPEAAAGIDRLLSRIEGG